MGKSADKWDRRKFLKKAGIGALAAASTGPLMAQPAEASKGAGKLNFRWISVSQNTAGADRVVMTGNGAVDKRKVVGSGSWNHFDPVGPPPFPLLAFGTWQAKKLVSLDIIGTYGAFAAGILIMEVNFNPEGRHQRRISAEVTMNCNVPPAGLFTGLAEGFFLTLGGSVFEPVVLPVAEGGGPPPSIAIGATVFTTGKERRHG